MAHTVFYSWQTDAPAKDCRNFIERALVKAIERLAQDISIDNAIRQEGLALDKDTKGVAGTPPIVDTIFQKIDAAGAFVADVTFVGKRLDGRPTPNPNVLLEYGWALKSRGHSKIVCVMNTAYGEPTDQTLPFNMKHLRWPIQYFLPATADSATRTDVQNRLAEDVRIALRSIIESSDFLTSLPPKPEPPSFEAKQPVTGSARFREPHQPLGVVELGFDTAKGYEVRLSNGPALWLRVMPVVRLDRQWSISELRQAMSRPGQILLPLGNFSSWSYVRGPDGFGYVPTGREESTHAPAVSFAFKSGEVWIIYAGSFATEDYFPNVEMMFAERFTECVRFMRDGLGIALPYRWIAGIEGGIKGKRMQRFAPAGRAFITPYTRPCLEELISESGFFRDGDKVQLALKPFFLKLYDACGEERGDHMDAALLALQG
jgi:hypothetical protein